VKMFPTVSQPADLVGLQETLSRIANGSDFGQMNMRRPFDMQQRAESRAQAEDKRDFGPFQRVFESHGCVWVPATRALQAQLGPGGPVMEGIWTHPNKQLALSFTPGDVFSLFITPEDLDKWIVEKKIEFRMRRRGAPEAEIKRAIRRR
jgi:hypothetical protein